MNLLFVLLLLHKLTLLIGYIWSDPNKEEECSNVEAVEEDELHAEEDCVFY